MASGNSANLPAPYLGQNSLTPTAVLKSPFCETLFNFNTTESGISLRNGDSAYASKALNSSGGKTTELFFSFVPYDASELFMLVRAAGGGAAYRYYSVTGSPALVHTSTTMTSLGTFGYSQFKGRVFIFDELGGCDYYDGSTWGAATYTFPGSFVAVTGSVYKNRQYFVFDQSATYGYTEIDAVSGTVTAVDLSGIISNNGTLFAIAPFTISNETSSQKLLAFIFSTGEVLFYSGSYPDSPTWELVGSGFIDIPIGYNSIISPYRGDSLVVCRNGLYSMRDLFLRGSQEAINLVLSSAILPDWSNLTTLMVAQGAVIGDGRIQYAGSAWWKQQNRIVIAFPRYVDSEGVLQNGVTYFVFDTLRGGWAVHRSFGIGTTYAPFLTEFNGELLFCSTAVASASQDMIIASKEGATDFQDVLTPLAKTSYDFTMLSAPIPFPKTAVYEATGIEPILESDLYAETNWNFVADFGRQTSGDQTTNAPTTAVAKPLANVGIQNITYVQVKMSGTTAADKTVGLDLYSYNVWYDAGMVASR